MMLLNGNGQHQGQDVKCSVGLTFEHIVLVNESHLMRLNCSDFYEPGSIMLEEEAQVIAGLLVGLNVIDCNMGIKDEDLDKPVMLSVIFLNKFYDLFERFLTIN